MRFWRLIRHRKRRVVTNRGTWPPPETFSPENTRYPICGNCGTVPDTRFCLPQCFLGASSQAIHFANAVLLYLALILTHNALSLYTTSRWALLGTIAFAVYWPVFATIDLILTETLAIFLFAASVCFTCRCHADARLRITILASVALASLALTKVILGYVLLAQLLVHGLLWLMTRGRVGGRLLAVYAGAMVLCIPYLTYTYSITGRAFYWSTAGGSSLYWMSYPGPETTGEWKSSSTVSGPG